MLVFVDDRVRGTHEQMMLLQVVLVRLSARMGIAWEFIYFMIWRGRVLWWGYVHPHTHPHTQLKKSGIPHTHTQSMRKFPSKRGRIQTIPTARIYLSSLIVWDVIWEYRNIQYMISFVHNFFSYNYTKLYINFIVLIIIIKYINFKYIIFISKFIDQDS